ncbi:WYL domain-containing protein [Capnocytophaga leadbetteri]|uniref:helix-turn-helix transcriptional regulator n=1 Tax=Capnocytophaga leadbetteri TaxID=327575 RepID=UPI0028EB1B31|nr:WYL domain-containing protein [Capnocytophaga leadbetteri]
MSLAKTFLKHRFIIEQLRRRPQKLIELNATWKDSEDNVEGGDLLQRTLQRDIQVIREVYNIEIKCNRSTNEYEITKDNDLYAQNLLEAFDVFRALQNYGNLSEVIQFEKQLPAGTEYLSPLLRAIKEKRQVKLHYYKFWDRSSQTQERTIEPYLLKEAQRRWYLLAWDVEKEALRVFGLDRIKRLDDERGVKFQHPVPKGVEHYFDDSFGAWVDNERTQAEEVVLAFKKLPTDTIFIPNPAKYLEAMPLHSSQEILKDEEEAIVLRLRIKITPDFIKELLSYGKQVEVLTPAHLQEELTAKQK